MGGNKSWKLKQDLDLLETPDSKSYKPEFFRANDRDKLLNLVTSKKPTLHDQLPSQIKELIKVRNPGELLNADQLNERYEKWALEHDVEAYGVYVYYPWSNRLVHILDEDEFVELRTSRNRFKITTEEQNLLKNKKIGVIGLSVGQSVALTMAIERIVGSLRIADFDTLELSNLNRIRSSVYTLGVEKTVMVAREVAEIDPYIDVELFDKGINEGNIESFLWDNGPLDLLVEVCDSLQIKILSRLRARSKGIPVLMDTSDRCMVDVERFDQEPNRPILHGKVSEDDLQRWEEMDPAEKMELLKRLVDFESLSERMKLSFSELGKSISTWPQLASDVTMGGAVSTKIARRILLGDTLKSGRYYLDGTEEI